MQMKDEIQRAIEDADFETRSYSGRGMYGKSCLAVSADDPVEVVAKAMAAVAADNGVDLWDLAEKISNARTDSMGRGIVIYWPGIPYDGPDEDDEEEND
jgi:hypothetical protein